MDDNDADRPADERADGDGPDDDGEHNARPADDLGTKLKDEASARDLGDFISLLDEALAPFLSSGRVSVNGNFFLGETRLQDAVAGDKYAAIQSMAFSGRIDSGHVPAPVLDEIRATFVDPQGQHRLEEQLSDSGVILYRVPFGRGATTSALRALDRLGNGRVWKLNPEVKLSSLRVEHLEEGGSYFVESLEPEQSAVLRPFHLEQLSTALKKRRCHLIVRIRTTAPLPERETLDEWLFDSALIPPDAQELVRRHVARHLGVADDDPQLSFLEQAGVRELIDAADTDGLPVRRIIELSALLALVGRGEADVADVRDRFSVESDDLFRMWFEVQLEAGRLPFTLSLAVFDRLQESIIDRSSRLLTERIREWEQTEEHEPPKAFGEPRRKRLAEARADAYETVAMTQYGPGVVHALRYLDNRVPQRVLRHIWQEHGEARQLLLDWLKALADDPIRIVRLRAGGVLGLFALHDFEQLRRDFLAEWASHRDVRHREVVLAALRLPARDPGSAPLVSRMVEDWSRTGQPLPLRWTAARALGASVGRSIAARALRLLKRLAAEPDVQLVAAVADSVTELFMDREKDLTELVLDHLLLWTDTDEAGMTVGLRDAGIASFLQLCARVRVEVPEGTVPWPTILWLASRDECQLRKGATLMQRALEAPRLFHVGYDLLLQWVRLARHERRLREPMGAFLAAVAQTPQDADTLRGHLLDWQADDDNLTEAIGVLLASLDGRGVGPGNRDGREGPQ